MNEILLWISLVLSIADAIAIALTIIYLMLQSAPDFSEEDVQVKAMTEQDAEATERVVDAKNRLPK